MLDETTKKSIKDYLERFVQGMIDEHRDSSLDPKELRPALQFSKEGQIKPFHEALLPDGVLRIAEFERSFSTKLGTSFEEVARTIGQKKYVKSERGFRINGMVSAEAIKKVEGIHNRIDTKGMGKDEYPTIVDDVVDISRQKPSKNASQRATIADLYLMDDSKNEFFFEMKSPKPNKGQCLEATDRLLQIHAIRELGPPKVRTYYAMAYSPYGDDKKTYKHSFACKYMDMNNQVLIGKEFWDLIGGKGTYEETLKIYREVGREKGPEMIDQLALNY